MFKVYHHTKIRVTSSNIVLVIVTKPNAIYNICTVAVLLFSIPQNYSLK
jgi:hypothetical protein